MAELKTEITFNKKENQLKQKLDNEDFCIKNWENYLEKSKIKFERKYKIEGTNTDLKLMDFHIIRTVGTGKFGRVLLTELNGKFYAIKVLKKLDLIQYDQVQHAFYEKRIMQAIDFQFLVNLNYFLQNRNYLYYVMPFVLGGELRELLRRFGHLQEKHSQFYASQVVLGLEYLHYLGLIYRDIKPENILIDIDGYIKLTDFSFCKVLNKDTKRTYTICGTPEYLSPEIILNKGYGLAVDWWSLGILIYEMCAGNSPFSYVGDHLKIYTKILSGTFFIHASFTITLENLLKNLLKTDPTKRLGNLKYGARDVKNHVWFHNIYWDDILDKKIKPPYIPNYLHLGDDRYFDVYKEENYDLKFNEIDVLISREFESF